MKLDFLKKIRDEKNHQTKKKKKNIIVGMLQITPSNL